ncbi:MAG: hypothetical protein HKN18_15095 [Silicimonas sp.]|nr:hypothetical protein [Silicimonas sp.]
MEDDNNSDEIGVEFVARILGAVGHLMRDFRDRDLALQDAVADLTCNQQAGGIDLHDLQHIDLITQTHADLAKFLPKLAQCLRKDDFEQASLVGTLTLRSLQDVLLGTSENCDHHRSHQDVDPGEMVLF